VLIIVLAKYFSRRHIEIGHIRHILVSGAYEDLYDTAIVISSDTDLIPAIKYVINAKGKKVEYIGFSNNPSFGLLKESTDRRLFSKTDLIEFQKS